jgi:endonuclease/exonuclease/phosphatase family metal-dependent hydrolase
MFSVHAELRLVTWNVGGNGLTNWTTDMAPVQAVGRILQHLQPDVIALQEIPNENRAYANVGAFAQAYLPGFTNFYSSGTDGVLRSVFLSRFPVRRFQSHLDGVSLIDFGSSGRFTRDLFEAEVEVPGFATPVHVFTTHLKAGSDANSLAVRAAEASAISNYFTRSLPVLYPGRPFVLMGDINEDVSKPRDVVRNPIPRLTNAATTLVMLNATNPVTFRPETWSSRFSLNTRFDYVLASRELAAEVSGAIVFRSDRVNPLPDGMLRTDSATASDHLPIMATIGEVTPILFRITEHFEAGGLVTLAWEADAGVGYRVERSADLRSWVQATATRATNRMTFPPGSVTEFYRIQRVQ